MVTTNIISLLTCLIHEAVTCSLLLWAPDNMYVSESQPQEFPEVFFFIHEFYPYFIEQTPQLLLISEQKRCGIYKKKNNKYWLFELETSWSVGTPFSPTLCEGIMHLS